MEERALGAVGYGEAAVGSLVERVAQRLVERDLVHEMGEVAEEGGAGFGVGRQFPRSSCQLFDPLEHHGLEERVAGGEVPEGGGVEFAEDAVCETPFALPGRPRRYVGRAAIGAHLAERRTDEMSAAIAGPDIQDVDATVY